MSAIGKLEDRLNNILSRNMARRSGLVRSLLLLIVLTTVATTFRLDSLDAQTKTLPQADQPTGEPTPEPTTQTGEPAEQPASAKQPSTSHPLVPQTLTSTDNENDLYNMVRDCVVTKPPADKTTFSFNLSGKVTDANGNVVSNAIVVIRDNRRFRIVPPSPPIVIVNRWERFEERDADICAKTTTDASGQYQFRDVQLKPNDGSDDLNTHRDYGLIVVHEKAGVDFGSLRIPKTRVNFTSTVDISLAPPTKVSGQCVTQDGQPVEGAVVTLLQLQKLFKNYESRNSIYPLDLSLYQSRVQPRARTEADGSFEFLGLPAGCIAEIHCYHSDKLLEGICLIATSDASAKKASMDIFRLDILRSPARLQLEPDVRVHGVVVDDLGNPVSGALVKPNVFGHRATTDASGMFEYNESALLFKASNQLLEGLFVTVKPIDNSGYLQAKFKVGHEEMLLGKPVQFRLQKGVKVTGRVETEEGHPLANVRVEPHGDWWPQEVKRNDYHASKAGVTNRKGEYEVVLLPGTKCELLFATDESGYYLPSKSELTRGKVDPFKVPHLSVEVTDGQPVQLKPFVVSKLEPLKMSVLRGDGSPARGAVVRFREQSQPQRIDETLRHRSKLDTTNELGQVSMDLERMPSDRKLIEATLIDGNQGYLGLTSYANAKTGNANIQLKPGKLIQGIVRMNGQTVADAQVGIHTRTTTYGQQGSTTVRGLATNEYDITRTNDDGSYRIVVPNDKEYEVNVQFAGGQADKLLTAVRPLRKDSDGVLTGDFNLKLGEYEISGVVVDANDKPLAHIQVEIEPTPDASPADFIAHNLSQFTTDSSGRFSLRNLPEGNYSISVRRPPMLNPSNPGQLIEQEPTRVTAKSGDRNLRVKLMR